MNLFRGSLNGTVARILFRLWRVFCAIAFRHNSILDKSGVVCDFSAVDTVEQFFELQLSTV